VRWGHARGVRRAPRGDSDEPRVGGVNKLFSGVNARLGVGPERVMGLEGQ
jgi:hypothetical protein